LTLKCTSEPIWSLTTRLMICPSCLGCAGLFSAEPSWSAMAGWLAAVCARVWCSAQLLRLACQRLLRACAHTQGAQAGRQGCVRQAGGCLEAGEPGCCAAAAWQRVGSAQHEQQPQQRPRSAVIWRCACCLGGAAGDSGVPASHTNTNTGGAPLTSREVESCW
jgi:hypothetical protein